MLKPAAAAADAGTAAAAEVDLVTQTASMLPKRACGADGFIRQDGARGALADIHGAENLMEEELSRVDSSQMALVLLPDEPATRAEMFRPDKTSSRPRYVRAGGGESQWLGPAGLFVGAGLANAGAANGGPFEMMGFQNHNAGEVTDWLGGALAARPGDSCEFALALALPESVPGEAAAAVSGDPDACFRSDSPEMRAANPSVDVLALQFFDPQ